MSFTNTPAANVDGLQGRSSVSTHRKVPRSSMLIVVTSPPHVGGHLAEPVADGGRHELGLLERGQWPQRSSTTRRDPVIRAAILVPCVTGYSASARPHSG